MENILDIVNRINALNPEDHDLLFHLLDPRTSDDEIKRIVVEKVK